MKIKLIKPKKVNSVEIVENYLKSNRPNFKTLKKIKKMKIFASAMADPNIGIQEAKQLAGIDPGVNAKTLMDNPMGKALLAQHLDTDYTAEAVRKKIAEFWNAEDVVVDKIGNVHYKPNWDIQDKTLTRVLKMKKWVDAENDSLEKAPPTQVIFNVIAAPK